ncbi:arginine--tRNA ligase [Candidatus Saccharibacteria bacterium]|nr:arginine--tRNA ligase [Candidatus Saccharibacteria bacterium]
MEELLAQTIARLYKIDVEVRFSRPDPKFGDYSTNIALKLAKELGRNSREIANDIIVDLQRSSMFSSVSVAGAGFINLEVSAITLLTILNSDWSKNYGENDDGRGRTVVVEYPSPNMAKPYSVGHLRPANQGWAARQLMKATGWNVITDNHLGDYGAPFGIWVVGFIKYSSDEKLKSDGVYELGRVYIKTKQALKDEELAGASSLASEVQSWLIKLEQGDDEAKKYSKRFNDISLAHIHDIMHRMKISTDYEYGEAFFAPRGKQAVQQLLDKGVAVQNDDNSVIVPLDDFGFNVPLLVQKSNGAALYATTDLATILFREENWQPDKVIYVVGGEQQFYFSQLFAMARKLGINTELTHLWFGVIDQINDDGVREKMSSRKGVVLMEDLLNKAEARAREIVLERNVSDEDIKKIALGAIKYSDFVADRRTNILFDWKTIFALTGHSGPYVQYAAVRVNKILNDSQDAEFDLAVNDYDYESEKAILLKIMEYPSIIRQAATDLEPHKVANYLYELARIMNKYYETTRVKAAEKSIMQARLGILKKVSHIFTHGLGLIGIEVPDAM